MTIISSEAHEVLEKGVYANTELMRKQRNSCAQEIQPICQEVSEEGTGAFHW